MATQFTADSADVYGKLNRRATQFDGFDRRSRAAMNAEAAKTQAANADKPVPAPMYRMSEEEDNQSRAFTQQCFAAAFDFGTPNRTYLRHQFGEDATQFAGYGPLGIELGNRKRRSFDRRLASNARLDDPNGQETELPPFLRGEGPKAWPESGQMPYIEPSPVDNEEDIDDFMAGWLGGVSGAGTGLSAGSLGLGLKAGVAGLSGMGATGLGVGAAGLALAKHIRDKKNAEFERKKAINASLRLANRR